MNNKINEIIKKYTNREYSVEKVNEELAKINSGFFINPNRSNPINVEVYDITTYSGKALLDSGTGSKDPVIIKDGKLVDSVGDMYALILIGEKTFHIKKDGITLY